MTRRIADFLEPVAEVVVMAAMFAALIRSHELWAVLRAVVESLP